MNRCRNPGNLSTLRRCLLQRWEITCRPPQQRGHRSSNEQQECKAQDRTAYPGERSRLAPRRAGLIFASLRPDASMEVPQTYVRDADASGRPCDASVNCQLRCTVPVPTLMAFWVGGRSVSRALGRRRDPARDLGLSSRSRVASGCHGLDREDRVSLREFAGSLDARSVRRAEKLSLGPSGHVSTSWSIQQDRASMAAVRAIRR
jgi:hypothetical protein